tara:strand:+ start:256 stop:477 length:222 start_codon:yes stop_codon:yes gene_type:complete
MINGYEIPKNIINTAVIKKILFAPMKNSFERSLILLIESSLGRFFTNNTKGANTRNADIPSKYNPLVGSLANE